jgi:Pro-kumamolisin, activation domain
MAPAGPALEIDGGARLMQRKSVLTAAVLLLLAIVPAARCQSRQSLLTGAIDESKLVALSDHPAPVALNSPGDLGPLADDYPLAHLKLVFRRTPEAEAALAAQIDAMHNPQSPEYHHWLTAQQIGDRYGVSPHDGAIVRDWLVNHGFTVHGTYKGGFAVDFSGTAGLVRSTFHTELH